MQAQVKGLKLITLLHTSGLWGGSDSRHHKLDLSIHGKFHLGITLYDNYTTSRWTDMNQGHGYRLSTKILLSAY